jgi:CRP-like cAMP-binding protein
MNDIVRRLSAAGFASIAVQVYPSLFGRRSNQDNRPGKHDIWHWGGPNRSGYHAKMSFDVRNLSVFKNLPADRAQLLSPLAEPFLYDTGSVIFRQGQAADCFYLVVQGRVEITYKPYDGNTITMTHVDSDGLFGWSAVIANRVYTTSAIAVTESECIRMQGEQLRMLCLEHPKAGREILHCLASAVTSRWKDAHDQVQMILERGMNRK